MQTTASPRWIAAQFERPLSERLQSIPDEVWKQRGLIVLIPGMLTVAYVSLLEELFLGTGEIAAIFCNLSVFYVCMVLAVGMANALVPDAYRSGPRTSAVALVGIHTVVTLTGVAIGAELGMALLWLVGGAEEPGQGRAMVYSVGFMIGFLVQAVTFLIDGMAIRVREGKLREELAKLDATQARLDALQARTHPHFLFNSLNVIAALVALDPTRAEDAIETLSELMRYAIDSARERSVSLDTELEAVKNYLSLERLRYGDRLRVEIEVPAALLGFEVPPLCLQPIVENAVVHGISTREEGGELSIRARTQQGDLILSVEDDGAGPGASPHTGTGTAMADLRARLELLYGRKAGLSVREREAGGCHVELTIPLTGGVGANR